MSVKEETAPAETQLEKLKRINRLAAEIYTFVEDIWPHFERSAEYPDTPFDRKAKGVSNAPIPESAIALMSVESNRFVSRLIRPLLEEIEASTERPECLGVEFRDLIREMRYDPGAITKWRDSDAKEEAALWTMCVFVAKLLTTDYPELDIDEFWVETSIANAIADTA